MKKRLFIILLVIAALLLAGLGTIIGTGGDWCCLSQSLPRSPSCRSSASWRRSAGWPSRRPG